MKQIKKKFETYFDRNPPTGRYTKRDFRKNNLIVYSTGKAESWYVRIWMGERKSHGMPVSDIFKTKEEAEKFADRLADYISDVFIVKETKCRKRNKQIHNGTDKRNKI